MLEVGPAFVAVDQGILAGGVVGEGCGGEVGGYVVVSAVVGACVHGGEVVEEKGWTAPEARGVLGGIHLSSLVVYWEGGYVLLDTTIIGYGKRARSKARA